MCYMDSIGRHPSKKRTDVLQISFGVWVDFGPPLIQIELVWLVLSDEQMRNR